MNDTKRNKLNMYVLVRDFLLASVTITDKISVFAAMFTLFSDYVTEIFGISELQERNEKGVTKTKKAMRAALIAQMEKVSKKCVAFASGIDDMVFMQMVKVVKSQLNMLADADLVKKAEDMVTNVTPRIPDLVGYNVTAAEVKILSDRTADFAGIYTAPTGNVKSKALLTKRLEVLFDSTDGVLGKMDLQVGSLFDTDAEFHNEYFVKRAIVNLARRKRALEIWISDDETGLPLKSAVVKIMPKTGSKGINDTKSVGSGLAKNVKRAGAQGGIIENNMAAGEYIYEISMGGYITQTGSFFINDGLKTVVRVKMVKIG